MTKRSQIGWLAAGLVLCACQAEAPQKPTPTVKAPEPAPIAPVAPPPAAEAEEVARTLLGLNQKPQPTLAAAQPMKRSAPKRPKLTKDDELDMSEYPALEPGLSDHEFQRAIDAWDGFKNCLAMAAYRNGRSAENGALKVEFEIQQSGQVVRSRVMESKSPELAECVETRSKKLRFPAFAGMDRITKEAKFIF